jgi:hypothetical protein
MPWQLDCRVDYAGWAQAIGGFLAVYGAFMIGNAQTRHAAREKRNEEIERLQKIRYLIMSCEESFALTKSGFEDPVRFKEVIAGRSPREYEILAENIAAIHLSEMPSLLVGRLAIRLRIRLLDAASRVSTMYIIQPHHADGIKVMEKHYAFFDKAENLANRMRLELEADIDDLRRKPLFGIPLSGRMLKIARVIKRMAH